MKRVDLSIVTHAQEALVYEALNALAASVASQSSGLRIWVTLNMPEPALLEKLQQSQWPFDLRIIQNAKHLGFGANHNQAFARAQASGGAQWFCVMNPDVLWPADAAGFWAALEGDAFAPGVGLVCPQQVDEHGKPQDHARPLPTPWGLAARTLRRMGWRNAAATQPLPLNRADWANGACMVWRSGLFAALGGFDERYFLYCEDTDICLRMRLAGHRMQEGPATVVHLAQRNTSKSLQHLAWHMRSLLLLWRSAAFWRFVWLFKVCPLFRSHTNV